MGRTAPGEAEYQKILGLCLSALLYRAGHPRETAGHLLHRQHPVPDWERPDGQGTFWHQLQGASQCGGEADQSGKQGCPYLSTTITLRRIQNAGMYARPVRRHCHTGPVCGGPVSGSGLDGLRQDGIEGQQGGAIRPAGLWEGGSGNDFSPAWGKEKRPACRKAAKRFSAGI